MNLFSSAIFEPLGWTLLHFIWQGAVIAVLFAITLIPLSRCSARVRYLVACGFLAAMAVCPMLTFLVIKSDRSIREPVVTEAMLSQPRLSQLTELGDLPTSTENRSSNKPTAFPAIESESSPNTAFMTEDTVNRFDKLYQWIEPWIPYTVVLWLGGVGVLSLRLLLGWVVVVRLRRNVSAPAMTVWVQRMDLIASRLRVSRSVKLVESALVEVPTVIGWMRPMILIPTSAFTGLTTQQLEGILAHELAHIRRHDFLVNLVQSVIETLLFYHPAVWWLSKCIRDEREHCCDDLAVSVCDSRSEYIRALVEMESLRSCSSLAMAANGGSLLSRARRLLQPTSDIPNSASWGASLLAIGSLLLMLSLPYWIAQPEIAEASEPQLAALPVIEFRIAANYAGSNSEPIAPTDWKNREFRDGRTTETSGFETGFVWFPLQVPLRFGNEGAFQVMQVQQVNEYVQETFILFSERSEHIIRPGSTWSALTPKVVASQKSRGLVDELGYAVQIQLTGTLRERISDLVRLFPNRRLAVIVNGEIIGHTMLNADLVSSTKLDVGGYFTREWAEDLVRQINGERPDPLEKPVWFGFQGTLQSALASNPTDSAEGSREIPVIRDICLLKKLKLKVDTASIKAANIQLDKPFRFEATQLPLRKALDGIFAAAEANLSYRLSDDQTELIVFAPPLQSTATTATATGEKPDESDDDEERKVYTHPITVSGLALDEAGEPVADAKIYLISIRAEHKRVAETVTDAKGRYEFKDAALPIEPAQRNSSGHDHGTFEVFGSKPGKAFAWRPRKTYFPKRNSNTYRHSPSQEVPSYFFADDPIELDLTFGESKSIQGQITDESGAPLAGVRMELRRCEKLQSDDLIERGVVSSHHQLEALNQPDDIPGAVKKRVTDSDGRFAFTDVPAECEFSFNTRIRDYSADDFYAATTERELPAIKGIGKIHTKEVLLKFVRTVDVPIKVVFGDTGHPAPKVFTNMHTWSETNENGIATLKLAPGIYKNQYLLPARGTRYLVTEWEEEVVVTREPPKEPLVLKLKPACELDVTIVDADTGQPISDVDLWMSDADEAPGTGRSEVMFRSFESPNLSHVDRPKSSKEGKLRALVEPGKHRFGVGNEFRPTGHKIDQIGQLVDCPASQKIEVTFKLKRSEASVSE